jgi:dTDP-4-amino-4,6-dideoxygalactose transaminase
LFLSFVWKLRKHHVNPVNPVKIWSMFKGIQRFKSRVRRFLGQFYRVPYCVPAWGWAEHWAIIKCVFTGCMIEGRHRDKLYDLVRQKTGMKYVFGFNSGQQAITAVLKAWGVCSKDRVIMPSYCCETVARAVIAAGAQPFFCDIDEHYNPDVSHILTILDKTVRAIIFPHLFGNPGDIDELEHALEKKKVTSQILLIDDAAQSFGARLNGRLVGTFGDAGIISFGPGKTMTATGGGVVITNRDVLAQKLNKLHCTPLLRSSKIKLFTYWIIFRRWRRFTLPFFPYLKCLFQQNQLDNNITQLNNLDAALGAIQLTKLDKMLKVRINRKQILDRLLSSSFSRLLRLPPPNNKQVGKLNVATKYIACFQNNYFSDSLQNEYNDFLDQQGIELQSLYTPVHHKPVYQAFNAFLPNTEKYYKRVLQIPLEPSTNTKHFEYVYQKISEFFMHIKENHAAS